MSVREVAAQARVSIATVSRVLNNSGYVSADVRQRVLSAVQSTGYAPNFNAKHLRTGRSKAVGFLVADMSNPFVAAYFSAVEVRMQAAGFSLLVASTYDRPEKEAELLTLFESRRLEGVIASPSPESACSGHNPFARSKLPMVIMDRDVDCNGDFVYQDHRNGVRKTAEYLLSLGHRRIALLGPSLGIRPGREKLLGYQDALRAQRIPFDEALVCMLRSAVDSPETEMREMLSLSSPPTAMIALGTRILSGALRSLRDSGKRVPNDMSVVGIGTENVFGLMHPSPTTLRFNIDMAASATAQLMLDRLNGLAPAETRRVTVPLDLVLGESCAPHPPIDG